MNIFAFFKHCNCAFKNLLLRKLIMTLCFMIPLIACSQYSSTRRQLTTERAEIGRSQIVGKYIDITKYMPRNHKKNGSVDYTKYIQKALDENRNVKMPNFPVLVTGLRVASNSNIYFQSNSKLILKPTSSTHYMILGLLGVENVNIYNAVLEGDYDRHLGKTGEWGYGVDIRGSRNVKILNSNISNCWGDGICISSNPNSFTQGIKLLNTSNITIKNSLIDFNRRNGITIASGVENIYIDKVIIANTYGTLPKAAIDLEPDHSKGKLDNIHITNSRFINNNAGINFHMNFYADSSKPNNVTVNVENVSFVDQESAFYFGGFAKNPNKVGLKGLISIKGVELANVRVPISRRQQSFGIYPPIRIEEVNVNKRKGTKQNLEVGIKDFNKLDIR